MNKKAKAVILMLAVALSFVGFNLLVPASTADLLNLGKAQGYHVDVTVTAERSTNAQPVVHFNV
jgi:hypothetical protein